jgi:hypothetical protein
MVKIKSAAAALIFAVCAAGGLRAQGFALSAGAYGDLFALGTIKDYDGAKDNSLIVGGGFGLFFDAAYVEIGLGMDFGQLSDNGADFDMMFLTFSVLAKYPITRNERLTVFPLLGVGWKIFLAGTGGDSREIKRADLKDLSDDEGAYDAFSIDAGAGADFTLTAKLYFRVDALLGFKLPSKSEQDAIKDRGAKIFTCGPTIKAGLGYKF